MAVAKEKICSICGNPFTPASNRQTYCNSCKPGKKRQPVEVTPEDEAAAAEILALITQVDETAEPEEPAPQEAKPEAKMEPAPVPTPQAPAPDPLAEAIRLLTAEAQDLEKRLEVTRRKLDTLSSAARILHEALGQPSSTETA